MASKSFLISESGWKSLSAVRDSIKLLFDVDISLIADKVHRDEAEENGVGRTIQIEFLEDYLSKYDTSLHQVLLETSGSAENIEKAQKYSCACFPSNSNYQTVTLQLDNLHIFEMVHRHSTHIQQSTASVLKFNSDHLQLTVQGNDSCVDLATKEIKMILEDADPKKGIKPISNTSNDDHNQQILPNANKNFYPADVIQTTSSPRRKAHKSHAVIDECLSHWDKFNKATPDSCFETDSCSISDQVENADSHMPFNIPSQRTHYYLNKKSSASSSSTVESDDDNSIVPDVLTDPRNSKQVDQAIKLGYSINQIQTALEKLGPGCTSDNLLSELIKIGNEQSDLNDVLVDKTLIQPLQDISLASSESENGFSKRASPLGPAFKDLDASENLRSIVIDGSNVAMSHGQDRFSCKGIKIAVDWFRKRGHTDITVFVPQWRKEASRPDAPIEDQHILHELERERIMTFTPSRRVQGRRIVSYDDRYVLKHAVDVDGIVVSNDVYRDLVRESDGFRKVVEQRLLMYTFVKDKFMPPDDPFGRLGPSLDDFLRKVPSEPAPRPQDCPYGKKCTYGNKCRFYHPERGFTSQKSITDTLKEQANVSLQEIAAKKSDAASEKGKRQKQKLARTKSLIPGESLSQNLTSDSSHHEASGKSKPRLGHSKSLISPVKNEEYLTPLRLKLEEAETIESSRKLSLQDKEINLNDFVSSQKVQKHRKGSSDVVRSYSPSPRTSPAPPSESLLMGNIMNKNFTSSGIMDTGNISITSAHLVVPNSQPQESYSSGHLSVAKKLSDEGSENKFFIGNRSSPSPPSSLLDEISAFEEKKHKEQSNVRENNNGSSQNLTSKELSEHPNFMVGTIGDDFKSQNAYDSVHHFDDISSPVSGHIPNRDSGNYSMYSSPQPMSNPHNFSSFPPATKKDNTRHPHAFHRSLSTSHSLQGSEHFLRQTSDVFVNEHLQLRQQQSTPLFSHPHQNTNKPHPGILLRQNSSSNPDIVTWPEIYDSGKGFDLDGTYHSAPLPRVDKGVIPIQGQQQYPMSSSQMPVHQLNAHFGAYQFHGPQGTSMSTHNPSRSMGNTLPSYPPMGQSRRATDPNFPFQVPQGLQQPAHPLHSHNHGPVFYSYPLGQPHHPQVLYHQDMTCPHSPYPGQELLQTQQPFSPLFDSPGTENQSYFSRPMAPQSQSRQEFPQVSSAHQGNPVPFDQEAQIPPSDSRYYNYYHLSTVYGEKVVRTFMNRNPDVKDYNQLIKLISAYKLETGM